MRTIGLVAEDAATRRPIVKDAQPKTVRTVKKFPTKILIKLRGGSELVVEAVHKNGDVALFLVLRRVVCRKFIRCRGQKFLEIGFGDLDRKSTRLNSSHLGISYA